MEAGAGRGTESAPESKKIVHKGIGDGFLQRTAALDREFQKQRAPARVARSNATRVVTEALAQRDRETKQQPVGRRDASSPAKKECDSPESLPSTLNTPGPAVIITTELPDRLRSRSR